MGARALGPARAPPPAPAVTAHNEYPAGKKPVGCPYNPVHGALARPVTVVKEMLRVGVINRDDREFQHACLFHAPEPYDTGGGLLGPAQHIGHERLSLL